MPLRWHGRIGAVAAASVALLAGCSGDGGQAAGVGTAQPFSPTTSAAPAADIAHACDLINRDEIVFLLGLMVSNGERIAGGVAGQTSCGYAAQGAPIVITIAVIPPPASAGLWTELAANEGRTTVEDLGDAAFIDGGALWVLAGDVVMNVFIGGVEPAQARDATVTLAELAISRL
jgi:hypothetical protein